MNIKSLCVASALCGLAITLSGCGKNVPAGFVGVEVKTIGSDAGVQKTPLATRWHALGLGESVVLFPTTQHTYQWTKPGDGDNKDANEEFQFSDNTALPMTADVSITVQVEPSMAPSVYQQFRLDFPELLDGPIRAAARTAISEESEKMKVEDIYSGGRQGLIARALKRVQDRFRGTGIDVSGLNWIGSIRYPDVITQAILNKTKIDQETFAAQANVAKAKAEADAQVATAQGEAEATKIQGEALRANPEVLKLKWIDKWDGKQPQVVGSSTPMIEIPSDK